MEGRIVLKYAKLFKEAANSPEKWARGIIVAAFKKVMGRAPTLAEAQLAQAVGKIETNYGKSWKGEGAKSHNWGAIQDWSKKKTNNFKSTDIAAGTKDKPAQKYKVNFKSYPDDISGAADLINNIFKTNRPQYKITPDRQFPAGSVVPGPGRGELCLAAAAAGDIMKFSAAMYHTGYYGGTASTWQERIKIHAKGLESIIRSMASSIGEPVAASIKSDDVYPVTSDLSYLSELKKELKQELKQEDNLEQDPIINNIINMSFI